MAFKVQDGWFSRKDANEDLISMWCSKVSDGFVHCSWCQSDIKVGSKAFGAVRQHSEKAKHNTARKLHLQSLTIVPRTSSTSTRTSSSAPLAPKIGLFLQDTATIAKEILWAIHLTMSNSSDATVDSDQEALKLIAPNDLKNFKLGRTKLGYIKTPIAEWFWDKVHKDISGSFYTLMFDDTTNNQHTKELQLVLKYWSKSLKRLNFIHLKSAFMESGKAQPAVDVIQKSIEEHKLNIKLLLQLGTDGPNVTKAVKAKMNSSLVNVRGFKLLDIGSCHDHILHNSLKKGCKSMESVHHFCQQVSEFFKTTSRWLDFSSRFNVHLKFVTFFSIRWTTLGPATSRILQYWNQIKLYFADIERNKKKDKEKLLVIETTILDLLASKTIHAEIAFVNQVASIVEPVLTFLERKDQVIFQADRMYFEMLCKLAAFIAVPSSATFNTIVTSKVVTDDQQLDVQLSTSVTESIAPIELPAFKEAAEIFISQMINYLSQHSFFNQFLYHAKFMAVDEIFKEGSISKILELSRYFKNGIIDEKKLYDELTVLVTSNKEVDYANCKNIDEFYCVIMEKGNPNLGNLFMMVSACSVSNAEVERYFSRSGLIITKKVSNLEEKSFNDRKHIISGMQFFNNDLKMLQMDGALYNKVQHASSKYKRKLEEEKQLSQELSKRQRSDDDNLMRLQLIADIQEEKELSKDLARQISLTTGKLNDERELAKKILSAICEKTSDTADADDKIETIRQLSRSLTGTNEIIKKLEENLNTLQPNLISKQSSMISKINQNTS